MFHPGWRRRALAGLGEPFDLAIVGAGITGCGVFLDAAQRGLRVLLVERGDVASGTSSRSSKLIHGGLRYLKQMQFGITRLACRERDRMLALSPHLVTPIRFVYPVYRDQGMPGWQVDLGLWMYDRLTRGARRHVHLDEAELARLAPGAPTADLDRTLAYYDAVADDARLTLAVAATGFAYGGLLLTRAEVEEPVRDSGGRVAGLRLRDLEDGRAHAVEARLVVNAAGAWVDAVRARLGLGGERVRPSRGSHLILPAERLPLGAAVTVPAVDDGRPVFVIPHPEGVLVGTTDLFHAGDLDDPRPTRAEIDYLLRAVAAAFPGRSIGTADVRGAFAGLRPIVDAGADEPAKASREEAVWEEEGVLSVAGGKLTTWRATAEEVVDLAVERLDAGAEAAPSATAGTPLGAVAPPDLPARLVATHGLDPGPAQAMARRLGGLAWTACALARDPGELRPLADGTDLTAAEARAHLRFGAVVRLEDLLLRRVRLGMWKPALARELLPAIEPLTRAELGWDARRWAREEEGYAAAAAAWSPEGVR
jgi:glycerol-3-phosphate dehydrogenase